MRLASRSVDVSTLAVGDKVYDSSPGAGYEGTVTRVWPECTRVEIAWHKWAHENLLAYAWHGQQIELLTPAGAD